MGAMRAAIPLFGQAFASSIGLFMKIFGPQVLAKKYYQVFIVWARAASIASMGLAAIVVVVVILFHDSIAFNYSVNVCEYAMNTECVPFFDQVVGQAAQGGQDSLQE